MVAAGGKEQAEGPWAAPPLMNLVRGREEGAIDGRCAWVSRRFSRMRMRDADADGWQAHEGRGQAPSSRPKKSERA